jgi:hypothetical protein
MFCVTDQSFRGVASQDVKDIVLVRALLTSRDLLLEELHKINKAVNEAIDTSDFVSNMNNADLLNFVVKANGFAVDGEGLGQGKPQNGLEVFALFHATEFYFFLFRSAFILCLQFLFYRFFVIFLYRVKMVLMIFGMLKSSIPSLRMNCWTVFIHWEINCTIYGKYF